ncbi:MAG TPA: ribbon-helix-helix domain-containing protein [Longimicrobium sp.]|nr:ribbon-helix-helix domain-containing protein [Longimicrobium sp.]
MIRRQVYLTEKQQAGLRRLSNTTGETRSELIRQAIDQLLDGDRADRLGLLRHARGIWKDRDDLPDFAAMRREADERFRSVQK